jgi:hypothetical protein
VDQPAKEQVRKAFDCALLPIHEFDDALVLPTGTVLGKKARQVLGVDRYHNSVFAVHSLKSGTVTWQQIPHGGCTLRHDPWVAAIEDDP